MAVMKVRITALAVAVAMLFVLPVMADGPAIGKIEKMEINGIENFSKLTGSSGSGGSVAGFGGATQPSAMPALKDAGFTSVINLRLVHEEGVAIDSSRTAAKVAGLRYLHLPLDTKKVDPLVIDRFLEAVNNEDNHPVYIHCGSATRAAALWMLVRVLRDGWEINAASAEAEQIALKPPQAIAFATAYLAQYGE